MISDESSSDSETGRFKCQTNSQEEQKRAKRDDHSRPAGRSRDSETDRFRRDFNRKREERDHYDKSRDRHRYSRHSPVRRRYSRERSPYRPTHDRIRHRNSRERSKPRTSQERLKPRDHRSDSWDKRRTSRSRHSSPNIKKDDREMKRDLEHRNKSPEKSSRKSKERVSLSPDNRGKRSEVYRPSPTEGIKRKSDSPVIIEEHSDASEEVQLGSYYKMIPAVVKDKSEESSEIDSSDDEKLRAKLLNLEKELQKTKKNKKHKKKHKKKSSKPSKDREHDSNNSVEVSSTTDIKEKDDDIPSIKMDVAPEVSSTQKSSQKESSEEGEISTEDSDNDIAIDPTDLRHKLRRTAPKSDSSQETKDVCGPVLPPHLEKKYRKSGSPSVEGPALPPHLKKKDIGPNIPDDLRRVLAETEHPTVNCDSSDEDVGIGPLPAGAENKWSEAHQRLEERALELKINKLDGHTLQNNDVKSREQWMLELPEGKAKYIGLEARSFRAKEGPDMSDRSSWTDTPEEKARKAAGIAPVEDADAVLRREARARQIANRDDDQESAVKKHKKKHKREESLLELHQKKLKKKKKKEEKDEEKKERRPFSRDIDLQANRFDEAQKKSIIKKAQDLNCRFSRGEAKYL